MEKCWSLQRVTNSKKLNDSVARFLESRGMLEDALNVATDPDYKFDLAVQLGKLEMAKVVFSHDHACHCHYLRINAQLKLKLNTGCCGIQIHIIRVNEIF